MGFHFNSVDKVAVTAVNGPISGVAWNVAGAVNEASTCFNAPTGITADILPQMTSSKNHSLSGSASNHYQGIS